MSSSCTHRISTASKRCGAAPVRSLDPTRCIDCGTVIGGRDLRPAWEHGLVTGHPDRFPEQWGLRDASSWLFSEFSPYAISGGLERACRFGGLHKLLPFGDIWLDAAIAANVARIVELKRLADGMGLSAPAPLAPGAWDQLPPAPREMRLTYFVILGWCALQLVNALRLRGGDYEGIVRPHRPRATPFSGIRHALAVAYLEQARLGPASRDPDGVEKHSIPGGIVFGQISLAPSHTGSGRAQGESHLLSRLAVFEALEHARVGQEHILDADGEVVVVHSGKEHLGEVHIELLRLVFVGEDRGGAAAIENFTVVPAIEELSIRDAFGRLRARRPRLACTPETEHQARLLFREARLAVADALFVNGLIPPPRDRSRRAAEPPAAVNPFAAPGAR